MCCCIINTDVMISLLLVNLDDRSIKIPLSILDRFYKFLLENMPVYVPTDLNMDRVRDYVEEYPKLASLNENNCICAGELRPRLEYFVDRQYNESMGSYIKRLASRFIKENYRKEGGWI